MKIVHIVLGRANPNRMNGVNRVVHNLSTQQILEGMDVTVWGVSKSYALPDEISRIYSTRWFSSVGVFRYSSVLKEAIISSDKETVFHLHGGFIPLFYSLSKLLNKVNKKFILTPHGTYTEGAMSTNTFVKKWYFKFLEQQILKNAAYIQCLGHSEESDLRKIYSKTETVLIPNGQNFDELLTTKHIVPNEEFIIGYCGRIAKWQKGLDILLKSFAYYKKALHGKGRLSLIGEGEYLNEMKLYSKELRVDNDIDFYGKKFGEEKLHLLKQMKLFIHTSRNEGLPTAVIEAASLGIPCLVSDKTSMDQYVRDYDAGYWYKDAKIEEIGIMLKKAERDFKSGELILKGANAIQMAKENFDWSVIAKQTRRVYEAA